MIYGLDLFSGIAGISVALDGFVRTIAYCEKDPYCQAILLSRMRDGSICSAPIWDDITTLSSSNLPENIDIITGGFPCQDISIAGHGAGLGGERSGLYKHIVRLVGEIQPTFVFLENVPAITLRGLEQITMDFVSLGYDLRWTIVSAQEIGAPHIRERWFCLAHTNGVRLREKCGPREQKRKDSGARKVEPDLSCEAWKNSKSSARRIEPRVGRTSDGIPYRLDRHRALGNSVVPAQAEEAFMRLIGLNTTLMVQ